MRFCCKKWCALLRHKLWLQPLFLHYIKCLEPFLCETCFTISLNHEHLTRLLTVRSGSDKHLPTPQPSQHHHISQIPHHHHDQQHHGEKIVGFVLKRMHIKKRGFHLQTLNHHPCHTQHHHAIHSFYPSALALQHLHQPTSKARRGNRGRNQHQPYKPRPLQCHHTPCPNRCQH